MTTKTRAIRPTQVDVEWDADGEWCSGILHLHPMRDIAHVRLIGSFTYKDVKKMRRFGKWLLRAAAYMEER